MRKKLVVICIMILSIVLVSCGNRTVSVKIPLEYFDQELIACEELQDGVETIERQGDQVLLVMREDSYQDMLEELRQAVEEELDNLTEDEDSPYVRSLEYGEDFREVRVFVDGGEYEETLDWTPMLISLFGETYQHYGGLEIGLHIDYIDIDTDEILASVDYPDL